MKTRGLKILVVSLVLTFLAGATVYAAQCVVKKTEAYFTLEQDVYMPADMKEDQKYPIVFMTHNGGQDKSAWGDFPQEIAKEGFITFNITWSNWDVSNVESAIRYNLEKYADMIDTSRVVFVGGCHGGKDFLEVLTKETDYTVKTAVLLSVSEVDDIGKEVMKKGHIPMLVFYSLNDEMGEEIGNVAKQFATEVVTKHCKVVAEEDPSHGTGMVVRSSNKEAVRTEIVNWVKKYSK